MSAARRAGLTIKRSGRVCINASGSNMELAGTAEFRLLTAHGRSVSGCALVATRMSNDMLVSWHNLIELGILPKDWVARIKMASFPQEVAISAACTVDISAADAKAQLIEEFAPKVLSDELNPKPMEVGGPMSIVMKEGAIPVYFSVPRRTPLRFEEQAKKELQDHLDKGVLTPVTEPTEWCSPGFFVPKPDGVRLRLVTDFTKLNKSVSRPTHPFPSSREIAQSIPPSDKAAVFAKMDCVHGYFQLALDKASSMLTTFILPEGRFRYLRAPMGLNASSDEWCRRSDIVLDGCSEWSKKIVDDILVWAPNYSALISRVRTILEKCRTHNITISLRKFEMGPEVLFAGYKVSAAGIRPDPKLTDSIKNFPTPKDIHQLRGLLGLAQQFTSFVPDLIHLTEHMHKLLRKDVPWAWHHIHDKELVRL